MSDYTPFCLYLDAVEREVGFPYAEVEVSVVERCWAEGYPPEACANLLMSVSVEEE